VAQLKFIVTIDVDRDAEKFAHTFEQYISDERFPFRDDFGPGAWGGYEGPFVTDVTVERITS
jgi:hypothetical protein